jgi:hypothetical protein
MIAAKAFLSRVKKTLQYHWCCELTGSRSSLVIHVPHPRNVDLLPYKPVIGESPRFVILVPFSLMNLRNNWGERLQYGVMKADESDAQHKRSNDTSWHVYVTRKAAVFRHAYSILLMLLALFWTQVQPQSWRSTSLSDIALKAQTY